MLRHLLSAPAGLIPAVIAVSTMALVVATGLATGHPLSLAQTSVPLVVFEEGNAIERFVKENSPAGASIGPPVVASGGDGQLTYGLSGDDATSFAIVTDTGQLLVGQSTSLDFESDKKTYSIIVTATGQSGQTASVDVTVVVEDVNEPPEFDIPSISFEVKENTPPDTKIGDPITATDPEDDDVTYSLTGTNAGLFDVDASDGQVRTKESLNYEAESMYIVAFSASDPGGSGNSTGIKLTIKIRDVSTEHPGKPEKPSVSPKPGNGHEALAVTWAAPENSGPPITSYVVQYRVEGLDTEWKQVTIDGNGVETTISGLAADTKYEAQVRAVNDEGEGEWSGSGQGSTFASMPVNTPPEFDVNAISTLSVSENAQPGTAIGGPFTASDSDRQDDLTYSLAGDDSGLFSVDDLSGQISVGPGTALDHESPADSDRDNVYDLTVRVTDGKDEQGDPDNSVDDEIGVTVRVTDVNEPPEIVSSVTELETDENIATSLAPLAATDPEGHTVSWSLDPASPDGGNFSLSVTGTLAFKTAPNYESPTDVDRSNDYDIIVVATDDGQPPTSSRVSLMIRVVNIDEDGVVSLSTLGPQMGVAITAELVDPDGGVTGASWQWLSLSDSQEQAIAGATDSSYTPIIADDGSRLQATVSYADAHGAGKYAVGPASHPVGDDSNSPPVFAVGAIVARQVAENTPADANIGDPVMATDPDNDVLTYSLSGAGSDLFDIVDSSGQIKTSSPLDHESQPEFRMTVTATDPGGLAVSAEITITVTDIDTEAPGKPDAPSVVPNSDDPIEALDVSWPVPLNTGPEITGYVVQHRVEGSGDGWTRVVIDRNSVETTISGLVAETEYEAQVHAVNAEGMGVWSESGLGSTLATVPVNTPPEFDEGPNAKRSVEENTPADTMIGDPVTATDPNNDELAYSLAGPDSGLFYVNPLSGQISIGAGTALDHESPADSGSDNFYELTVQVTDGKDGEGIPDNLIDDEIGVIVTVEDVNEPPEFTSSAVELEIEENSSANTNVGNPIIATDPESTELTYSLTGADADSFDVDAATGQIRTLEPLDYEDQNAFALIMIATDEGDLMAGIAVNIHVTNVNEAPVGATAIEDRTVVESDGVDQFDVSVYFSDPDGDELIYSATSSDSEVARVGFIGATLAVTPAEIGTATVEVTVTDPAGLSFDQSFTVQVVADQGGSGGSIPFIPLPPQESGGSSDTGNDQANLLAEGDASVVPSAVSLLPGQTADLLAVAFNMAGDELDAGVAGVACTWSSDGGGSFAPNDTTAACSTTFTPPAAGSGTITVWVTQGNVGASGTGTFVVIPPLDTMPGVEEEEVPDIPFPASVAGSIVSQPDGVLITSPNGLTMEIPAGAIDDYYLEAYIEDLASSEIDVPEGSDFIVGSHAGNFVFTDVAGNPIPGFRTNLPVRICLPITREDIDTAAGGIDGIRVVHQTPDGEFFHHPPDNDEANMVTCANVDRFSLYFVGLAVAPPTPTPMPEPTPAPTPTQSPTATPGPTPTPTLVPSPVPTPESTPVLSATADPTPEATPVLPITGDTTPGSQALLLMALAAAIVLTTGLTLRQLFRQHRSAYGARDNEHVSQ